MQHIDLNGSQWTLSHDDGRQCPRRSPDVLIPTCSLLKLFPILGTVITKRKFTGVEEDWTRHRS